MLSHLVNLIRKPQDRLAVGVKRGPESVHNVSKPQVGLSEGFLAMLDEHLARPRSRDLLRD